MGVAKAQKDTFMPVIRNIKQDYVEIIDVDELTENGIAFECDKIQPIVDKLKNCKIDALFLPFCDFGEESVAAGIASQMKVPTLVWGPRDTVPNTDTARGRDTQCGIIAATKVLSRCGVQFSYIVNSATESKQFQSGFETFLRASMVVKTMKNARIAQIGSRPEPFMSVISNEGELLERFGVSAVPISVDTIAQYADKIIEENSECFRGKLKDFTERIDCSPMDAVGGADAVKRVVAITMATKQAITEKGCIAASMECWSADQTYKGLPCIALGELSAEGIPISCEGDLNGAITVAMMNACAMGESPTFFADLTIRHPENDNAELLWHCGPFPYALKAETSEAKLENFSGKWELKMGDITLCRFDSINGEYYLFAGDGRTTDGPVTTGTYVWFETDDWEKWEERLVFGPYIHHIGGMYGKYVPALREAARYLGVKFDSPDACGPVSLR